MIRPVSLVAGLAALALVPGCAETAPRVVTLRPTIPARLTDCPTRPAPPEAPTQRDVALYLIELDQARRACRTRLRALARLLSPPPMTRP